MMVDNGPLGWRPSNARVFALTVSRGVREKRGNDGGVNDDDGIN